ncbi:HlyD family secretion protein [Enhydrobacter aerosaccus]|uniref:HlyD family secretion protein n=1 Tax=Enhydrobacter aerosaccus TaxID=225324 RepID=UPI001C4443E4|nr:HlyD family secretion protein [Enhydrobacter aerosaccus]
MLIGGPVLAGVIALGLYMMGGRYASTDDAYVQAARVEVSANISARVTEIAVHDNQLIEKGQLLFKLDDRPFRIAVENAEAQLASARLRIAALKAAYGRYRADERAAEDTVAYQQREFDRQTRLAASGISSHAQLDQATHDLETARQKLTAASQQTASALADLNGDPTAPADSHPSVQQAQAALDRARLDLSYTVVAAPMAGVVTRVEQLQVGDYVNAATPLFALVSNQDMWVEANFKETELTYMRPGQMATFDLDAYPGESFVGKVQSVSPGTGSSFSLLPPENASGNWVKVVQRLPVRLSIDRSHIDVPLAAGMSVTVEVDTHHQRSLKLWK